MSALQHPAFRRLAIGWGCSNFGDSALYLTLAVWVKDLTGSDASTGLIFLFLGLPFFLAPFAGHLADRSSRRRLAMQANVAGAALVLALWTVGDRGDVWVIYLVTFWYGFITYVTSAAGSGLVRDLLPDEHLASGNGLLNTIDQGLRLISPLVGVAVYAVWGGRAIAVLTATLLIVAAAIIATVPVVETPPTPRHERNGFWTETTAGLRHIRRSSLLSRLTAAMAVAFMVTGLANTTIFAAIEQGIERGTEWFGVFAAIQGGGAVLGGVTAAFVIARFGELPTMVVSLVLLGVGLALPAVSSLPVFVAASVMVGVSVPWLMVSFATIRQRSTPATLQGRVAAATSMALNGPQTLGTAAGAALIAVVDYRTLMVLMGVTVAACAFPLRSSARLEPLPKPGDAIPVGFRPRGSDRPEVRRHIRRRSRSHAGGGGERPDHQTARQ